MAPLQKPGRSVQDVGTPKIFLRAVLQRLEITKFDLDVASTDHHAERLKRYITHHYDERDNGLRKSWSEDSNWCNPPYGNIRPWVRKAWKERKQGGLSALLVPASPGANWWRDWVHGKALVLFLNGRITFVGQTDPYPKDCALLVYTPVEVPRYDIWQWTEEKEKHR